MILRRSRHTSSLTILRLALLLALVVGGLVVLATARRADSAAGQEQALQLAGALDADHFLEQTFTPTRDGLAALEVFARIPPGRLDSRYTLTLRLRRLGSEADLAVQQLTLVEARAHPRITFTFPPQFDSAGQVYLLRVESNAPADTVSLLSSREDVLPSGELRLDGLPSGRDLTLRVFSGLLPGDLLAALVQFTPEYALLLLFTLALAMLGGGILSLLGVCPDEGLGARILWAVGTGLSAAPLLFLIFGLSALWVMTALALLGLARAALGVRSAALRLPRADGVDIGLLLVFLLALAVRLLQVQDVPVPLWTDGLEHWQMARNIAEAGHMPPGLLYHIGYHSLAVLFQEAVGLPLHRALLLLGQWISALSGLAVYVLAVRLFGQRARFVGLLAALILSVFPSLPGYLINWGRYPYLLGLTLLPFALAATLDASQSASPRVALRRGGLLALLLAGLFLCHYGTVSFWISFTAVFLAVDRPAWLRRLRPGRLALVMVVGAVLALALLALRFGDDLFSRLAETIAQSRQTAGELSYAEMFRISRRAGGIWVWAAGLLGALWAAFHARRSLALSLGWFAAHFVLVTVQSPLLGYALASYANLLLAISLPLVLLAAGLLDWLFDSLSLLPGPIRAWRRLVFLALLVCGIAQVGILNPATLLFGSSDAAAAQWVVQNTLPGSRFLINSALWTGKVVPSDGGGWIEPITGRNTAYLEEPVESTALWETIVNQNVDYIYLGRFPGLLNRDFLSAAAQHLRPVYNQDGVVIYQILADK